MPSALPKRKLSLTRLSGLLFVLPALVMYGTFVLFPLIKSFEYSFYNWNGITEPEFIGLDNYARVFSDNTLLMPVIHTIQLIFFFTVIPVILGLMAATLIHKTTSGRFGAISRTVLFLPQMVPLVAAGIVWKWLYASPGLINQLLNTIGLGSVTRAWLADFDTALPAVGLIGTWVLLGFCTVLLLTGMSKIDVTLYEAARLDGCGFIKEFFSITLPSLVREIGVCVTACTIAAMSSFDIVFITTVGGPGRVTMVPGLLIYRFAFTEAKVGLASAMAVVLMCMVLMVVLVIQRLTRGEASS